MSGTGWAVGVPAGGARTTVGRRWVWLPTLVVGVGLFELVRRPLVDTGNPNLLPARGRAGCRANAETSVRLHVAPRP
jgi:hypothetical protein